MQRVVFFIFRCDSLSKATTGNVSVSAVPCCEMCFREKMETISEREMTKEATGASTEFLSKGQRSANVWNGVN